MVSFISMLGFFKLVFRRIFCGPIVNYLFVVIVWFASLVYVLFVVEGVKNLIFH